MFFFSSVASLSTASVRVRSNDILTFSVVSIRASGGQTKRVLSPASLARSLGWEAVDDADAERLEVRICVYAETIKE